MRLGARTGCFAALTRELVLSQIDRHSPKLLPSGGTVIVVQHAAQALAPLNLACVVEMACLGADVLVRQTLMIAFTVIMRDEVLNGCPQRFLVEDDHAIQAGLLDAAHKSLRVGVQVWRTAVVASRTPLQ